MKRGLPKAPAATGREARIRRAASSPRAAASIGRAASPWWHALLLVLMLGSSTWLMNPRLADDSERHFAFTRAIVVDHALATDRRAGRPELSGVSLLWSPFMLAANAGVSIARSRGSAIPADGRSWPYLWACAAGTAVYALLAQWMSYRLALRFSRPPAALLGTIAMWLATPMAIDLYARPFAGYIGAAFAAALVLYLWVAIRDGADAHSRWFVWGVAGGMALVTSFFNAAMLIVVLVECGSRLFRRGFLPTLVNGLVWLAGAAVIVVPAIALRREIDGGWLWSGNFPVLHWSQPHLFAAAFSADRGAFVWTPVLLVSLLGFVVALRRQPVLGGLLLVAGALFFYFTASFSPSPDDSFANPWLISLTTCGVCGVAALIDALAGARGRLAWVGVVTVVALLITWNLGLMLHWGTPRAAKDSVIRYVNERRGLVNDPKRGARE